MAMIKSFTPKWCQGGEVFPRRLQGGEVFPPKTPGRRGISPQWCQGGEEFRLGFWSPLCLLGMDPQGGELFPEELSTPGPFTKGIHPWTFPSHVGLDPPWKPCLCKVNWGRRALPGRALHPEGPMIDAKAERNLLHAGSWESMCCSGRGLAMWAMAPLWLCQGHHFWDNIYQNNPRYFLGTLKFTYSIPNPQELIGSWSSTGFATQSLQGKLHKA